MNSLRPRTLTDYLRAAYRHKFVYESSVSVIVELREGEAAIDPARRSAAFEQRAKSRALVESVIGKCGLFKEAAEGGPRVEDMISQTRADIRITGQAGPDDQYRISYRAPDAGTAQKVASELASQLESDGAKADPPTSGEADRLRKRALELSAGMRELEEKAPWLVTLKDAPAVSSAPQPPRGAQPPAEALRAQQMAIESLKDRQYLIQQQMADIERRIASERQIVEQQKKNSALRDNPTYAVLISRRTELQGQRDTLVNRQELTDKHPRVTAITDQIAAINRQIDELRQQDANHVSQSPEARELMSLESERNRLRLELEVNNREMARRSSTAPAQSPAAAAPRDLASARLAGQYFGLKRDYEEVTARLDDAESKRAEGGGAKPGRIRLLGEASAPELIAPPGRWPFILASLAAGLALGACFALAAGSRRFASLQDERDVDFYTRLPLLAAIPRAVTADDKRRARFRFAACAVVAAVATFALAEIFIITNVFTLIGKK
jgi:hypothetical protein